RTKIRLDLPDAPQLIADDVLIDVAGLQEILVARVQRLVGIGDDEARRLALQRPVVPLERSVIAIEAIGGRKTVGVHARIVEGDIGRPAHAARAGAVLPRLTRTYGRIHGLMHEDHVARGAGRGNRV